MTLNAAICASDRHVSPVSTPPGQRNGWLFTVAVVGLKMALQALTLLISPSATPSSASQAWIDASYSSLRFAGSGYASGCASARVMRPNCRSRLAAAPAGYSTMAPSQSCGHFCTTSSASRPPDEPPAKYDFVGPLPYRALTIAIATSRVFFSASPEKLLSASSLTPNEPSWLPSAFAWWPESLANVT